MREMKDGLEGLLTEIGKGKVEGVAYDTAWVARVRKLRGEGGEGDVPAFPLALEWLRRNQEEEGFWGGKFPLNPFANTLSTLSSILAFRQWGFKEDEERIKRGVDSLFLLAPLLSECEFETIGFELLLPSLVDEAKSLGFLLPEEHYSRFEEARREKLRRLKEAEARAAKEAGAATAGKEGKEGKERRSKISTWWFSLELLGHKSTLSSLPATPEEMIKEGPSVCSSPAATAFLLDLCHREGKELPSAFSYLSKVVEENSGGCPNVFPIDEFEASFSLVYLSEGGFSLKDPEFIPSLDLVRKFWVSRKGKGGGGEGLTYSSHFPMIDPDDSIHGWRALREGGFGDQADYLPILKKFFNGETIQTSIGERVFSSGVNSNVLLGLKLLSPSEQSLEVEVVTQKVASWLKTQIQEEGFIKDKWHYSPFYATSRALLFFKDWDKETFEKLLGFLLSSQRPDGGWGFFERSTMEESSHVSLALSVCSREGFSIPFVQLTRAYSFLNSPECLETQTVGMWIGKCLYCPSTVIKALHLAAKNSLEMTLLL